MQGLGMGRRAGQRQERCGHACRAATRFALPDSCVQLRDYVVQKSAPDGAEQAALREAAWRVKRGGDTPVAVANEQMRLHKMGHSYLLRSISNAIMPCIE